MSSPTSVPNVPDFAGRGHESRTNRGELRWWRSVVISTLVALLTAYAALVDQVAEDGSRIANETLDLAFEDIDQRIDLVFREWSSNLHFEILSLITELRDLEDLTTKQNADVSDTVSQLKKLTTRTDSIIGQMSEMEAAQAGNFATVSLIWQQFTNYLTQFGTFVVDVSEEWGLVQARDDIRNELLTSIQDTLASILTEVTYDEVTFRKKVRRALIGTTIIATTEYEAGGQCDVLPEECTLLGETEIEVEDVLGV